MSRPYDDINAALCDLGNLDSMIDVAIDDLIEVDGDPLSKASVGSLSRAKSILQAARGYLDRIHDRLDRFDLQQSSAGGAA